MIYISLCRSIVNGSSLKMGTIQIKNQLLKASEAFTSIGYGPFYCFTSDLAALPETKRACLMSKNKQLQNNFNTQKVFSKLRT